MRLDTNPLFRKVITPWYDSTLVCWLLLICMVVILLFSAAGIRVALTLYTGFAYIWVPGFVFVLSLFVCITTGYRLVRRYIDNHPKTREPS